MIAGWLTVAQLRWGAVAPVHQGGPLRGYLLRPTARVPSGQAPLSRRDFSMNYAKAVWVQEGWGGQPMKAALH